MSPVALSVAAVLASLSSVQAPPSSRDAADRQALMRLETVWNDAHVGGDGEALDRLWADEIVVTVPSMPVMGKLQAIAMSRSARMKFEKYETSDVRVQLYDNAAIVTGRVVRIRVVDGRHATDNWRFTKVYVRRDAGWRVVAWHASESAQ